MDVLYPTKSSYILKEKIHNMWTLYVMLKSWLNLARTTGVVTGNREWLRTCHAQISMNDDSNISISKLHPRKTQKTIL